MKKWLVYIYRELISDDPSNSKKIINDQMKHYIQIYVYTDHFLSKLFLPRFFKHLRYTFFCHVWEFPYPQLVDTLLPSQSLNRVSESSLNNALKYYLRLLESFKNIWTFCPWEWLRVGLIGSPGCRPQLRPAQSREYISQLTSWKKSLTWP